MLLFLIIFFIFWVLIHSQKTVDTKNNKKQSYELFMTGDMYMLGQPKQQVDVTQANDGDIQSESIDGQLAKGSHLMMGISKEKSLRTHH